MWIEYDMYFILYSDFKNVGNVNWIRYVFYPLLWLQKRRECMKGHQNNSQTPRILPCEDHASGFEIPESTTAQEKT